MTQAKHEALRRDIEDYKKLLVKYQSLRIEQEILTNDLERQSKLLESRNDKYLDAIKRIGVLEEEVAYVRLETEKKSATIAEKERVYNDLKRMYYVEKGKVYKMKKGQAEVYIWKGLTVFFFVSMLLVGSQ